MDNRNIIIIQLNKAGSQFYNKITHISKVIESKKPHILVINEANIPLSDTISQYMSFTVIRFLMDWLLILVLPYPLIQGEVPSSLGWGPGKGSQTALSLLETVASSSLVLKSLIVFLKMSVNLLIIV